MIALIDYGGGNVGSVLKAIRYLGCPAEAVARPEELAAATKIILPGQGHFRAMMKALEDRGMLEPLRRMILPGDTCVSSGGKPFRESAGVPRAAFQAKPFLGICLGLQVLYEGSDEAPGVPGLGVLRGRVKRFEGVWAGVSLKSLKIRGCFAASSPAALFTTATRTTVPSHRRARPPPTTDSALPRSSRPRISGRSSFILRSQARQGCGF